MLSPRIMWALSHLHAALYRASGGRVAQQTVDGQPVLLLTTRGRRSGRSRTTLLVYHRDGERFVVCGGSGGTARHPAWFLNLRADGQVGVQVSRRRFVAYAREAQGTERARLSHEMAARVPRVDEYQRAVARRVPMVVLEPPISAESREPPLPLRAPRIRETPPSEAAGIRLAWDVDAKRGGSPPPGI
jgi:deazaflavin-dependent oxidoreductase (nitroreductase family)